MTSVTINRSTGLSAAVAVKAACAAASVANLTLSGEQTIDGVALETGDRVLVKDQSTGSQNGVYVVDTGPWERAPDMSATSDVAQYTRVYVGGGTANGSTEWVLTTASPIIGTSALVFEESTASIADLSSKLDTADFTGAAIVSKTFATGLTGATHAPTILSRLVERITPEMFGASGASGSGAATANVTALNAAFAAAQGRVIVLPRGGLYAFNAQIVIPDDVIIEDHGSDFVWYGSDTGTGVKFRVDGDFEANNLGIYLPTGNIAYRMISFAGKTKVGRLYVRSDDQINNRDATATAAVKMSSGVTSGLIDTLIVDKFDNGFSAAGSSGSSRLADIAIGDARVTNYVRGLHFDGCKRAVVGSGLISGKSANASMTPGHNGILLEGCETIRVSNCTVLNAGEHGFRVGGSAVGMTVEDVKFANTHAELCGGSGIKVNDGSNFVNVCSISGHSSIDVANDATKTNGMGLYLERIRTLNVNGLTVRAETNSVSCYRGISMNAVSNSAITNFVIQSTEEDGIFANVNDGAIERNLIDSGVIITTKGHGINIEANATNFRDFHIGAGVHIRGYDSLGAGTKYGVRMYTTVSASQPCVVSAKIKTEASSAGRISLSGGANMKDNSYTM